MSASRHIWPRLWGYLREDGRTLLLASVCAVGVALTGGAVAYALKQMVDLLAGGKGQAAHLGPDTLPHLTAISLKIVFIYVLQWGFSYGVTVGFAESGQRLGLRLRNAIYTHLQSLSLGYFNRQRTGALMSTLNNDVPLLQATVGSLKDIAPAPFRLIAGLWIIFAISYKLSIIALVIAPLMGLMINIISRKIRQITRQTQDKLADVNTLMEETLSGIRIIQSFGAEGREIARFSRENEAAKSLTMWGVRQTAWLKPTIDVIGAVGVALAVWCGGYLILRGELTLGGLGAFVIALNQIAIGINGLGSAKITYEQVGAAGGRILENVLDVESEVQEPVSGVVLPPTDSRVEMRGVAFSYHADLPVLRDVSFTIEPGEVVAVVGPSGAGKSTIADLIPRFYDPQAGQILVDGHDVRTVTLSSLRGQIGIVPQETVLFGGTIRDNIAYGNPLATDEQVEAAARAANIHNDIVDPRKMPDGYQTLVGERGKQLSGGQRQRIAIARALLKEPRLLILDEATSALDPESEVLVQDALEKLMRGRTTLVIAHRLSTIKNAHKILVLEAGRIVEQGSHAELLRRGGLYARLYETRGSGTSPLPAETSVLPLS